MAGTTRSACKAQQKRLPSSPDNPALHRQTSAHLRTPPQLLGTHPAGRAPAHTAPAAPLETPVQQVKNGGLRAARLFPPAQFNVQLPASASLYPIHGSSTAQTCANTCTHLHPHAEAVHPQTHVAAQPAGVKGARVRLNRHLRPAGDAKGGVQRPQDLLQQGEGDEGGGSCSGSGERGWAKKWVGEMGSRLLRKASFQIAMRYGPSQAQAAMGQAQQAQGPSPPPKKTVLSGPLWLSRRVARISRHSRST